jgi:NADP-dependent 3-hydroxy acid dehydrogenase YdfG
VINAGLGTWAPFTELDPANWDRTLRTNLDGAYHTLRTVLPLLVATPGSLIVGLSSDSALHPFAGRAAYSASKAALQAMLEVVRREVRESGVRVSVVVPSRVDTFFEGGRRGAAPGTRTGALTSDQVAEVVAGLFALPPVVEVREIQLAAMTSTFGLLPERTQP